MMSFSNPPASKITGIGRAVPDKIVTNADMEKIKGFNAINKGKRNPRVFKSLS